MKECRNEKRERQQGITRVNLLGFSILSLVSWILGSFYFSETNGFLTYSFLTTFVN
jgi:hypothetical protein